MWCKDGRCKRSPQQDIFIVTALLDGLPTKAKEAPSPHKVRLAPLDTNTVFQCLGECACYLLVGSQSILLNPT